MKKKQDIFYLARMNRKARKRLRFTDGYLDISKLSLFKTGLDYALESNGGVFPRWTRKEEKFCRYMSVPVGGC